MSDGADTYLSPTELSARWKDRIKVQTLAKWRTLRQGPTYTKLGGRVLYKLSDIEAYEKNHAKVAA